jgi:hypothetical protein
VDVSIQAVVPESATFSEASTMPECKKNVPNVNKDMVILFFIVAFPKKIFLNNLPIGAI